MAIRFPHYLLAVAGAACAALSLELCYIPYGLMDGGMAGAAVLLGRALHLPPVYLLVPMNAACLIPGLRRLGNPFLATTATGLLVYGLILRLVGPLPPLLPVPAAILLGGAGVGLGIGLLLRAGGALDGCETLGLVVQQRFGISVVTVLVVANLAVFGLAIWQRGWAAMLPSLVAQAIGQGVIALVVRRSAG
ncbi:MAG: YitT family protein [Bacillota bacterium]